MNQELDRIKKDVETIQRAMGLAPSMGQEWIQWLKRDRWFSLLWCLPGLIVIAATLLPLDRATKYLGLVADQWAGILVAAVLVGIAIGHSRKITRADGRPEGVIREARRVNGMTNQGLLFGAALLVQVLAYFIWGASHHIAFAPFWSGFFILVGSTCLVAALVASTWTLLGYAIPFLAYGLSLPLFGGGHKVNGVLLGMMFIAVALSFAFIQVWQIRRIEGQHEAH